MSGSVIHRSVQFGMPTRGNDQEAWPFFAGFIAYPYQTAPGTTMADAIGPDGILIPPGGVDVQIPVTLPRDTNFMLHWIRCAAWRERAACSCVGAVAALVKYPLAGNTQGVTTITGADCDQEFTLVITVAEGPTYTFELYDGDTLVASAGPGAWSQGDAQLLAEVGGSGITMSFAMGTAPTSTVTGSVIACPVNYAMGSRDYLRGAQDFLATAGASSVFTAQNNQRVPWNEYIELTVYLGSAGDKDYFGAEQFVPQGGGVQRVPSPLSALQTRQDGPGQLSVGALLGRNTVVMVIAKNVHPTQALRLNGVLFGTKVA